MLTHPGVYCLRTNLSDWDQETLWRTYTMLTDLEAVFRSLKSELGLRPIFHQKQNRSDGHLFITVLAYQLVQIIRRRLAGFGETASWNTLRRSGAWPDGSPAERPSGTARSRPSPRRPAGIAASIFDVCLTHRWWPVPVPARGAA